MTEAKQSKAKLGAFLNQLRADSSGLAMVEFAVSLPFFLGVTITGVELANYAAVNTRVNQIAVHVADNAARMGSNSPLANNTTQISEIDINDVFTGARHEGDALVFDGFHPYTDPGTGQTVSRGNARIFLSSVEPVANPNPTNRYRIRWQRCSGPGTHYRPTYGSPSTQTNAVGIGPANRQSIAPPNGATMFAEIHYHFEPMLDIGFSKMVSKDIVATAAMVVRDSRNFNTIFNAESVTPSSCNFT